MRKTAGERWQHCDKGNVTIISSGSTTIHVRSTSTNDYEAAEASFTLLVSKATLTVAANDATRKYGEANPDFKVNIMGFANGEDESVLTTHPTATCEANLTSEYDIFVSGGKAANYKFIYIKGTLTVIADTSELEKGVYSDT